MKILLSDLLQKLLDFWEKSSEESERATDIIDLDLLCHPSKIKFTCSIFPGFCKALACMSHLGLITSYEYAYLRMYIDATMPVVYFKHHIVKNVGISLFGISLYGWDSYNFFKRYYWLKKEIELNKGRIINIKKTIRYPITLRTILEIHENLI